MNIGIDTITVVIEMTGIIPIMIEIEIIAAAGNAGTAAKTTVTIEKSGGEWMKIDTITEDVQTPIPLRRPHPTGVKDRRLRTVIGEADLHPHTIAAALDHRLAKHTMVINRMATALSNTAKASPQTDQSPVGTPPRRTRTPETMPKTKPPD